ncbi:MAG: M20 family metallopeptidase [Bacteroidales bacterium]|jgi:amidohydrolase|nr:M20 family metallopeptidase [Bacteroidales bacterium]MDD4703045.1 M20 family metallopeptidase [Bacteroidales bacterium]MDX9797353.1 M20 family metallopeptidase [Bacteroidales bacterium]
MTSAKDFKERVGQLANKYYDEVVAYRRHFHKYPELSNQEAKTSEFICSQLDLWGVEYKKNIGGYGIYGFVNGKNPNKSTIAFRADMDALPIKEETNLPFISTNEGVMHACGHDLHMASLLGTIRIMKELENEFEGRVMFIFQPSEETYPGGARKMLNAGIFDEMIPCKIFAFHSTPEMECGYIGMTEGKAMASTDEIYIDIIGKGGHGATPELNIDPILAASHVVIALQSMVSRNATPTTPTTFSIGKFIADGRTNVIPNSVHLEGIIRTFDEDWRKQCHELIERIASQTAKAYGAEAKVFVDHGYPFVYNDIHLTRKVLDYAKTYFGETRVVNLPPRMTAEDFSYFSQEAPSCYYRIGTRKKNMPITNLHTSKFDIDEESIKNAIGFSSFLAISFLNPS